MEEGKGERGKGADGPVRMRQRDRPRRSGRTLRRTRCVRRWACEGIERVRKAGQALEGGPGRGMGEYRMEESSILILSLSLKAYISAFAVYHHTVYI